MQFDLNQLQQRRLEPLQQMVMRSLTITLVGLLSVAIPFSWMLGWRVKRLIIGLQRFTQGDRSVQIGFTGHDELARIARQTQQLMDTFAARERELALLARAMDATHNGIIISDARLNDHPVVYVNQAHLTRTGYSREEFIGHNCRFLNAHDRYQPALKQIRTALATGEAISVELRNYRKDGTLFWIDLSISPIVDSLGVVTHYIGIVQEITERVEWQEALARSEEQLRLSQRYGNIASWEWRIESGLIEWSDMAAALFGVAVADLPHNYNQFCETIQAYDQLEVAQSLWNALDSGSYYTLECRIRRPDGAVRWLYSRGEVVRGQSGAARLLAGIWLDHTERKEAELALRSQKALFEAVFNDIPDALLITDDQYQIVKVNTALTRLFGYSAEELIGQSPRVLYNNDDDYQGHFKALAFELSPGQQLAYFNAKGEGRFCGEYRVAPIHLDSDAIGVVELIRDVSEREEARAALEEAKEEAERASQAKSEFLSLMSHEIRTPLNGIIGLNHLALDEPLSPLVHDYLTRIQSASGHLLGVINDILDFSKIEAGKLELEQSLFALSEILETINTTLQPFADSKGVRLVIENLIGDLWAVGDKLRFSQVLINLAMNGLKFTHAGLVTLRLEEVKPPPPPEGVPAHPQWIGLSCSVCDTGIGIAPEVQSQLFTPFLQADHSTTRKFGGTGLGLSISQRLVRLMGGSMEVESVVGKGSCFRFTIPLERSQQEAALQFNAQQRLTEAGAALYGSRILVAEDNPTNQMVVTRILSKWGVEVTLAHDGAEAVALFQSAIFDLVLMDIQMPHQDGYQATAEIRRHRRGRTVPIIAMTAHALESERRRCLAQGMDDHISKPFDPKKLFQLLHHWLSSSTEQDHPTDPWEAAEQETQTASESIFAPYQDAFIELNLRVGLAHLMGDDALYLQSLVSFQTQLQPFPEALATTQTPAEVAALAHALKGSSATMGALEVAQAAAQLEEAARAEDLAAMALAQPQLADHLRLLLEELHQLVSLLQSLSSIQEPQS